MILAIALAIIVILGLYILANSYVKESGISAVLLLFFSIVGFAFYILLGLQITKDVSSTVLMVIYWIAYTLLVITIINIFLLGYFWSVVRKKTGPYGVRGPIGDIGRSGEKGRCGIDSNQSFAIERITKQLDLLFKSRRDNSTSTLLKNKVEPINNYLADKINYIVSSSQYKTTINYMTAENIPLEGFYIYMSNIWSIWFGLIYDASDGEWFLDQYADENYDFKSETNPFDEIRKYDLYYWGIIDGFRRLKVEVCSDNIELPTNNIEPRLRIIASNDYEWHWNDDGSNSERDIITWKLKQVKKDGQTYYPIGVVGTGGDEFNGDFSIPVKGTSITDGLEFPTDTQNGPIRQSILVAGDVKSPKSYQKISYVGGNQRGWIWRPIAPDGYTCMGDLWGYWYNEQSKNVPPQIKDAIKCVPSDCVEEVPYFAPELGSYKGMGIWNQDDDWNRYMIENRSKLQTMEQNAYHIARVKGTSQAPLPYKFYKLKDSCLQKQSIETKKELEPQYNKMAIGWNGSPVKSGEKYSIFSLLGLSPEGIITNMQNGRKYYIIHYGGVEVNRYLILLPNYKTKTWNNAIEVSQDKKSTIASSSNLVRNKIHQQWIMKREPKTQKIYFVSYFNNHNLAVDLDSLTSNEVFSTTTDLSNKNYFNFVSSYGEKKIV